MTYTVIGKGMDFNIVYFNDILMLCVLFWPSIFTYFVNCNFLRLQYTSCHQTGM